MENNSQGVPFAVQERAYTMPEVGSVVAARAFHGTVSRCDDHGFTLLQADGMADRLRAGLLFHQQQFASGEFFVGLAQADDDLEGKKISPYRSWWRQLKSPAV